MKTIGNVSEKLNQYALTMNGIREAITLFNPSFHVKGISRNLDILENLYIHEVLLEEKDKYIDIIENFKKSRDFINVLGIKDRDDQLLDNVIQKINENWEAGKNGEKRFNGGNI